MAKEAPAKVPAGDHLDPLVKATLFCSHSLNIRLNRASPKVRICPSQRKCIDAESTLNLTKICSVTQRALELHDERSAIGHYRGCPAHIWHPVHRTSDRNLGIS